MFHLRPSGNSGTYKQPAGIKAYFLLELLDKKRTLGPGTHKTHFPFQHINELRYFIQPKVPENSAKTRNTLVVMSRPNRAGFLFRVMNHGSILIQFENFPFLPNTVLRKEGGPGRIYLDQDI